MKQTDFKKKKMSNTGGGGINTEIIKAILRKPTSHLLF
jgi:hypothetical protein